MRKRFLALVVVLFLIAGACSSDDAAESTTTTASEGSGSSVDDSDDDGPTDSSTGDDANDGSAGTPKAAAFRAAVADELENPTDPADPAFGADNAACLADVIIDGIGYDAIEEAGVTAVELAQIDSLSESALGGLFDPAEAAARATPLFEKCDLASFLATLFGPDGVDAASLAQGECVVDAFGERPLAEQLSAAIFELDNASEFDVSFQETVTECESAV